MSCNGAWPRWQRLATSLLRIALLLLVNGIRHLKSSRLDHHAHGVLRLDGQCEEEQPRVERDKAQPLDDILEDEDDDDHAGAKVDQQLGEEGGVTCGVDTIVQNVMSTAT